jgi:Mg/Co/Ni transporter MgtE
MSADFPVTIEFLKAHPRSAARALAPMDPADVAAFMASVPTKNAARVLSQMNAWPASIVLSKMPPATGAQVLPEMPYQDAVSLARFISDADWPALADQLPQKLRRDLRVTLAFPTDTVGANMTTTIVTMAADQTVGEARDELRRLRHAKSGMVFVIDASRALCGAITAADLLQGARTSPLSEVMDTKVAPLSARARLSTVTALAAWDDYTQLPVLSRGKKLIGALPRKTAQKAGKLRSSVTAGAASEPIAVSIANAFLMSFLGLVKLLADIDQPQPAMEKNPSRRRAQVKP